MNTKKSDMKHLKNTAYYAALLAPVYLVVKFCFASEAPVYAWLLLGASIPLSEYFGSMVKQALEHEEV